LWGWAESEVLKRQASRQDESLVRILVAAAGIKQRGGRLRPTTRHIRSQVAKCVEADGGIFELTVYGNKSAISV
jgi:hypothetical protein